MRLLHVGFLVSLLALVAALAPATAGAGVELRTALHGSAAYPRAGGHSDYERGSGHRELEVTLTRVARLTGRRVVVFVHGHRVGAMVVSPTGRAHRTWSTRRGHIVPRCARGDRIRIRTRGGRLVAAGSFRRHHHEHR